MNTKLLFMPNIKFSQLVMTFICIILFKYNSYSQNKKEQINNLKSKIDSIQETNKLITDNLQSEINTYRTLTDELKKQITNLKNDFQIKENSLKLEVKILEDSINNNIDLIASKLGMNLKLLEHMITRSDSLNQVCDLEFYFYTTFNKNDNFIYSDFENYDEKYPLGLIINNTIYPIAFDSIGNFLCWNRYEMNSVTGGDICGYTSNIQLQVLSPKADTPIYTNIVPISIQFSQYDMMYEYFNNKNEDFDIFNKNNKLYENSIILRLESTKNMILKQLELMELQSNQQIPIKVKDKKLLHSGSEIYHRTNSKSEIEICIKYIDGSSKIIKTIPSYCQDSSLDDDCCPYVEGMYYLKNPYNPDTIALFVDINRPCGFEAETNQERHVIVIDTKIKI